MIESIKWVLFRRLVRGFVVQDFDHSNRIEAMYKVIALESRLQFTEDNNATLRGFLDERYQISTDEIMPRPAH